MAENVSWNESESVMEKTPAVYNEFQYDTSTNGGCLNKLDEINTLINSINDDVGEIAANYSQLQGFYNEFTNYNDLMDSNKMLLQQSTLDIRDAYNAIIAEMQGQVAKMQEDDSTLMEDLENINSLISTGAETDGVANADATNATVTTNDNATDNTSDTTAGYTGGTNSTADLAQIADEVLQGKYGNGPAREAALRAMGVNPDDVQAIVNAKIKGTWTGGDTVVTPSPVVEQPAVDTNVTPAVDTNVTPPVENPTPTPTTEAAFMPSGIASSLINAASSWIGTRYVYGGTGNGGIDCSALVQKAAAAVGISLPRTTGAMASVGYQVSRNQVQPGDIIFTNSGQHVQIVSSVNADGSINAIGASSAAGVVKEQTVRTPITQIRRII